MSVLSDQLERLSDWMMSGYAPRRLPEKLKGGQVSHADIAPLPPLPVVLYEYNTQEQVLNAIRHRFSGVHSHQRLNNNLYGYDNCAIGGLLPREYAFDEALDMRRVSNHDIFRQMGILRERMLERDARVFHPDLWPFLIQVMRIHDMCYRAEEFLYYLSMYFPTPEQQARDRQRSLEMARKVEEARRVTAIKRSFTQANVMMWKASPKAPPQDEDETQESIAVDWPTKQEHVDA